MNPQQLNRQLDRVAGRISRRRLLGALSVCWLLAAAAGAFGLFLDAQAAPSTVPRSVTFALMVGLGSAIVTAWIGWHRVTRLEVARAVERAHPALEERLLAAVEQTSHPRTGQLRYLQQQVIGEVLDHHRRHDWLQVVPRTRFLASVGVHCATLLLMIAVLLAGTLSEQSGPTDASIPNPAAGPHRSLNNYGLTVEPGETSVERGTSLLVLARFADRLPQEVALEHSPVSSGARGEAAPRNGNEPTHRIALTKSLDDPLFAGRIENVAGDLTYRIAYDGHRSREFRVTVFDYPELERADAAITFPEYTRLPSAVMEDVRRLSAVEGSSVRLTCTVNKPIESARLLGEDDKAVPLKPVADRADTFEATLQLKSGASLAHHSREKQKGTAHPTEYSYRLELVDAEGRHNKSQPEFVFEVTPNRRPELKFTFPGKDLRASPLEEVPVEATVWDDFGLEEYGVIYTLAGGEPVSLELGQSLPGQETGTVECLLALEQLEAEPNQLLAYYVYADDYGPDGRLRRTFSDMYFAEVRPFEEIFRQGQQPPGGGGMSGGGRNGQEIEKLVRLQKEIVNATWNVFRRGNANQPGEEFSQDVRMIAESQESALEQLRKLGEKLSDPTSQSAVRSADEQMSQATESLRTALTPLPSPSGSRPASGGRQPPGGTGRLTPAARQLSASGGRDEGTTAPLSSALTAERSAYQSLLNLKAREHRVAQSQSGGGGGGGGSSRSQQQLQQLELTNQQNRYETENQAGRTQSSAQREQRQVLNRLRELARRQSAVNQRLKELQHALREAKTEQQKEEIHRRLKRLREEQQKLLRDLDELNNRMNRPENQRQMAEDRRRLQQTRSRVLQSSEALERGLLSRALTSGTRAERELQELRNEVRRRTAGQFAEAMQQLRRQARQTSDEQSRLAEQLRDINDDPRGSLRTSRDRRQIADDFDRQKQRLDDIFDSMRRIIREAENSESHLSEELYETVRKTRAEQPRENLQAASELLNRGLLSEADRAERQARQGIDVLRSGIEEATEAVLADRTEALKQARDELESLTEAVEDELAQAGQGGRRQQNSQTVRAGGSGQRSPQQDPNGQDRQTTPPQRGQKPDPSAEANRSQGQSGRQSSRRGQRSGRSSGSQQSAAPQGSAGRTGDRPSSQNSPSAGGRANGGQPGLRGGRRNPPPSSPGKGAGGEGSQQASSGTQDGFAGGPGGGQGAEMSPLTGPGFREWSDRMRDVEEMVDDPKLRNDVARIRERARSVRAEFKRHSKPPNWPLVRTSIFEPLVELQLRLAEEIARRESPDALVPIDRDPVPDRFRDLVRRYYERLGRGQ